MSQADQEKSILDVLFDHLERVAKGPEPFKAGRELEPAVTARLTELEGEARETALNDLVEAAKSLEERGAQKIAERVNRIVDRVKDGATHVSSRVSFNDGFESRMPVFCANDWMGGVGHSREF